MSSLSSLTNKRGSAPVDISTLTISNTVSCIKPHKVFKVSLRYGNKC